MSALVVSIERVGSRSTTSSRNTRSTRLRASEPFAMAFWDNRSTQHYAVMDYPPCHRKMERAGIVGEATY